MGWHLSLTLKALTRNWSKLAVVLLVVTGGSWAEADASSQTGEDDAGVPYVRSELARQSEAESRYRFPGTLRASERAAPAFLHPGVLRERHVVRGQQVEQGEPLARLHNPAMEPALVAADARVRELDANLVRLERDVERARALRERNLNAAEELDRLRAEFDATTQAREQALAQRDEARAQLDELTLRAPFAGVVTDLHGEPGDFVTAGQSVMGLVGTAEREVEVHLPAWLAVRLEPGQAASLSATRSTQRFAGRIADIGWSDGGVAPVIVAVESAPGLAVGEPVQVHLAIVTEAMLEVPLTAVLDPGGYDPHVLVLTDDNRVRRVSVAPGRLNHGWVALTTVEDAEATLVPGARVITAGQGRLEPGNRVSVLP